MTDCPECGKEVSEPYKRWEMQPKRKTSEGKPFPRLRISLYACNCGRKFRVAEKIA